LLFPRKECPQPEFGHPRTAATGIARREPIHPYALDNGDEIERRPAEAAQKAAESMLTLAGTGKRFYDDGIPEANIPACAACHGPDAKGQEAIPRLAGQLYAYTVKELANWSRERGQGSAKDDTSAVMTPIAHAMTPAQVSAIAAYLSYLR
jgi:cytochrome c553